PQFISKVTVWGINLAEFVFLGRRQRLEDGKKRGNTGKAPHLLVFLAPHRSRRLPLLFRPPLYCQNLRILLVPAIAYWAREN
ncbi:MAG TPA: hypothetical protein V6D06_01240, partial [Trichocoleus sp.]